MFYVASPMEIKSLALKQVGSAVIYDREAKTFKDPKMSECKFIHFEIEVLDIENRNFALGVKSNLATITYHGATGTIISGGRTDRSEKESFLNHAVLVHLL